MTRETSSRAAACTVLLDASQLTGQSAGSGIGTYVRGLLEGLGTDDSVRVETISTTDATVPAGVTPRRVGRHFHGGRPEVYEHEVRRSAELLRFGADVFHNPNPHAPRFVRGPWVQTLHDVIPLVVDDPVAEGLKRRFQKFGPRYAKASAVIAVSQHAADEGMRHLGVDARRITVIPHGVSPQFHPAPEQGTSPTVLIVCEVSQRKGILEAVQVIDELAELGYPHTLRIVGKVTPWARPGFEAALRAARHPDRVITAGFVDDLVAEYNQAEVVLVPSRYEGFGFPALEAMACGRPVVSFDNTSLPEVIGDAGVLVPDGDVGAMVEGIRHLLDDRALRDDLAGRAADRAAQFTWRKSAAAHAEVYRHVAGL